MRIKTLLEEFHKGNRWMSIPADSNGADVAFCATEIEAVAEFKALNGIEPSGYHTHRVEQAGAQVISIINWLDMVEIANDFDEPDFSGMTADDFRVLADIMDRL